MTKLHLVKKDRSRAKGWLGGISGCALAVICAGLIFLSAFAPSDQAQTNPATKPTTSVERRWELLAHGSGERLWLAVTTPANWSGVQQSIVRERAMQGNWYDLSTSRVARFP